MRNKQISPTPWRAQYCKVENYAGFDIFAANNSWVASVHSKSTKPEHVDLAERNAKAIVAQVNTYHAIVCSVATQIPHSLPQGECRCSHCELIRAARAALRG